MRPTTGWGSLGSSLLRTKRRSGSPRCSSRWISLAMKVADSRGKAVRTYAIEPRAPPWWGAAVRAAAFSRSGMPPGTGRRPSRSRNTPPGTVIARFVDTDLPDTPDHSAVPGERQHGLWGISPSQMRYHRCATELRRGVSQRTRAPLRGARVLDAHRHVAPSHGETDGGEDYPANFGLMTLYLFNEALDVAEVLVRLHVRAHAGP